MQLISTIIALEIPSRQKRHDGMSTHYQPMFQPELLFFCFWMIEIKKPSTTLGLNQTLIKAFKIKDLQRERACRSRFLEL
jgi:hypothetical protein